ncbi:ribosomal protein S18-alanine N-acetyltransferase [Pleurocapsales cyanobacterium LEGE 10410]|nr:ribosomal protein S18-alanine N-acetyltransferase [Pleurocapsales cyanobacterium LEGE 10410]
MKTLEIQPLTALRVPEIVALDEICIGGLWTAEAYLREIDSPRSSLLALYLDDDQSQINRKIIGMACLWAIMEEAHITLLGVHPDYRGRGLGQLLLLTLLENAIARQLEWATLEVNVKNSRAIELYQKFGFQVVGTRKGYYQPAGDDALVLWLKGIQQPQFKLNLSQWQKNISDRLSQNHYHLN